MPFKPRRSTERELRRRCKQVAKEVARITSTGADATSVVYALEEYAQLLAPWAQDVMLKIVEMSDQQNLGMWRELGAKMAERLKTLYTRDAVAIAIRDLSLEGAKLITSIPLDIDVEVETDEQAAAMTGTRQEALREYIAVEVETAAQAAAMTGTRHEALREYIASRGGVAQSRAELIARTEVSRQTTILTQTRAVSIGSEGYIWRTADDGRVRPSHAAMNGQFVKWSEPPTLDGLTGHAGALPNCRCYPEPVV